MLDKMESLDHQFSQISNQIAGEIYHKAIEGVNGNVVISPLSILTAVSFLMFGASGKTLSQMKNSLKYDAIEDEILMTNFQQLMQTFEGKNEVKMANKIYLKKNSSVKPKFQEIAKNIFQSNVESMDFGNSAEAASYINEWVEAKTNNKIKDLITAYSLDVNTRLVLINAIYYKVQWAHGLYPSTIRNQFSRYGRHTVEIDFTLVVDYFQYGNFEELGAAAVQIPLKSANTSMMIILPNSLTGLSALESKLHQIDFGDLSQKMNETYMSVFVPKFEIESHKNLKIPLMKMGMNRMFSDEAEFENLLESSEPIQVSEAIHKAIFDVNEESPKHGGFMIKCATCELKMFFADKPFLFAIIRDSTVLFIGRKVE